MERVKIYLEGVALSFAVRPWFYTLFHPIISRFKKKELHKDFKIYRYLPFQANLGISLLKRGTEIFEKREKNALYLYEGLKGTPGILLPSIPRGFRIVFNQFPVLIRDPKKREILVKRLIKKGIEVTTLYKDPIHRIYPYDYKGLDDPFPNATYISNRLLLIPVHPFIGERELERVVKTIKEELL